MEKLARGRCYGWFWNWLMIWKIAAAAGCGSVGNWVRRCGNAECVLELLECDNRDA